MSFGGSEASSASVIWPEGSQPNVQPLDPLCRVDLTRPILLSLDSYSQGLENLRHFPDEHEEISAALQNYNWRATSRMLTARRFASSHRMWSQPRDPLPRWRANLPIRTDSRVICRIVTLLLLLLCMKHTCGREIRLMC